MIRVCCPRDPRLARYVAIPRWASDLLVAGGCFDIADGSHPLIQITGGGVRRSLQSVMRTVLRRLGRAASASWSWVDLRAVWQARAGVLRATREVQRGTWWAIEGPDFVNDPRVRQTLEIARGWTVLADPPQGRKSHPTELRRHAPSHRAYDKPEEKRPWTPPPLPESVTARGQIVAVTGPRSTGG